MDIDQFLNKEFKDGDDLIVVDHLKKAFGSNVVLKDINLKVKKSQNLVVLGKSGIGKSVLIKCIVGLYSITAGRAFVLDEEVSTLEEDEINTLRKRIGYLFQGGALYDSMTVRENLAFPVRRTLFSKQPDEVEAMVVDVLKSVGLESSIDKVPSELSGGMKKRVGLARTLILKPDIILYDEPTTGLDPVTGQEISELMLSIKDEYDTTSITITHDMKCARMTANHIMVLRDGVVSAQGSYDELSQSDDEEIRAYFT